MPLEFGIEPPRWLTESVDKLSDPLRQIKESQARLNLADTMLQMQMQKEQLETAKTQRKALADDLETIPKWLRENDTWQKRETAIPPLPKSQWGRQTIAQIDLADSRNVQRQVAVEAAKEQTRIAGKRVQSFTDQVKELERLGGDPTPFLPHMNQVPTPAITEALGTAIAAAQQHKENLEVQKEIEREQAKIRERTAKDQPPHEFSINVGGQTIRGLYNPATGRFQELKDTTPKPDTVIKKRRADLQRRLDMAEERATLDPTSVEKKAVVDNLKKKIAELTPGAATVAPAPKKIGKWIVTEEPNAQVPSQ